MSASFRRRVIELFHAEFPRLYRYLGRLAGDPDLAADLAQEAFVRLHARGALPDDPPAWLATVATNLFRNERVTWARRQRLLTPDRAASVLADPAPSPSSVAVMADERTRVRRALDRLPERERKLLLLRAEGYGYREIASVLSLNEHSVGTLLARAKRAFCTVYEEDGGDELDASR